MVSSTRCPPEVYQQKRLDASRAATSKGLCLVKHSVNFFTAKEKVGGVSESEKTDSCSKDVHMKFALVFYRSSALWAAA